MLLCHYPCDCLHGGGHGLWSVGNFFVDGELAICMDHTRKDANGRFALARTIGHVSQIESELDACHLSLVEVKGKGPGGVRLAAACPLMGDPLEARRCDQLCKKLRFVAAEHLCVIGQILRERDRVGSEERLPCAFELATCARLDVVPTNVGGGDQAVEIRLAPAHRLHGALDRLAMFGKALFKALLLKEGRLLEVRQLLLQPCDQSIERNVCLFQGRFVCCLEAGRGEVIVSGLEVEIDGGHDGLSKKYG